MFSRPLQNVKLGIFTLWSCSNRKEMHKKSVMHVQMLLFCQSKPIAFLPFSLTWPLSLLKLLNGAVRLCKPTGAMESLSALSARFCVLLLIYILSVFTWRHGHIGFPKQWTAAMLVFQTNPVGVGLFSYVKHFFCSHKFAKMLATWVNTLHT